MPSFLALLILLAVAALAVAVLIARGRLHPLGWRRRKPRKVVWKPVVEHKELPGPDKDPLVTLGAPEPESFAANSPPLADLPLDARLRGQLDGYALGRAKRILEAPDLLHHAAADHESWPIVEQTVNRTLAVAESRGVRFTDRQRLMPTLALCAAHGVLLAEWRQLEDGRTAWSGEAAQVRASDAFTVQRLAEAMYKRIMPDLFAATSRRPPDFPPALVVSYCIGLGFYLRLHGNPPTAFAREVGAA